MNAILRAEVVVLVHAAVVVGVVVEDVVRAVRDEQTERYDEERHP
jgi:hypothetical protein